MADYQVGDRVRVTVEGAVAEVYGDRKQFTTVIYASSETDATGITFVNTGPAVTFERLGPAGWPPRPGDVWRDREGDLWFAIEDSEGIELTCTGNGTLAPAWIEANYSPLTLVFRVERDGGK